MMPVVQGPTPLPPGIDPTVALIQIMDWVGPVAMLIVGAIGLTVLFRSPVGEAIAERIRRGRRARFASDSGEQSEVVAALEGQVASLRTEVTELAERLDFAERVLAERREPRLRAGQ